MLLRAAFKMRVGILPSSSSNNKAGCRGYCKSAVSTSNDYLYLDRRRKCYSVILQFPCFQHYCEKDSHSRGQSKPTRHDTIHRTQRQLHRRQVHWAAISGAARQWSCRAIGKYYSPAAAAAAVAGFVSLLFRSPAEARRRRFPSISLSRAQCNDPSLTSHLQLFTHTRKKTQY